MKILIYLILFAATILVAGEPGAVKQRCGDIVVTFTDRESFMLTQNAEKELIKLVECLKKQKGVTLTLYGHTDRRGTDEYNLAKGERYGKLIQKRLKQLLKPKKVNMKVFSMGESRPLYATKTYDARNNRVEVVVSD